MSILKRVLTICGGALFLVGVGLGIYLILASSRAEALDSADSGRPAPGVSSRYLTLETSDKVLSENDTLVVAAHFSDSMNTSVSLRLSAPGFTPSTTEPKPVVLTDHPGTLEWVLTPTKIGTFQILAEMEDPSGKVVATTHVGVTVTNVFGLRAWQLQLLSYVTTLLGPMLTVPWWYERWKERKAKEKNEKRPQEERKPSSLLPGQMNGSDVRME